MTPSIFLLLLTITTTPATATHDLVTSTCTEISSSPNIHYDFCVSTLTCGARWTVPALSEPRTLKSLALLSVKLTATNATQTKTHIRKLLKSPPAREDKYVRSCLLTCLELYSDAVQELRKTKKAIGKGRLVDCAVMMSSVVDAGCTCDDGFRESRKEVVNPLERNDADLFQLAVITLAIVNLL